MEELSREQLLEDLQARRSRAQRERGVFNKRTTFLSLGALLLFAALAALILSTRPGAPAAARPSARVEHFKRVADRLKAQGVRGQAMRYYERYLDEADLPTTERVNVCYVLAELAAEDGRYEEALAWLARAEQGGPEDSLKDDVARLQRLCFERLGRPLDADYQLAAAASLDGAAGDPRAKPVAVVAGETITMGDIDDAIQALPKAERDLFAKPENKAAFVQSYVLKRILLRKAERLGYDRDPRVRQRAEDVLAELVVQAFIEKEVRDKIDVTESELNLYYQVHQADYGEPAQVRLAHILVATEKAAAELIAKIKAGADFADVAKQQSKDTDTKDRGGEIAAWLSQGGRLPELPQTDGLSEAVFTLKPGDVAAAPVKSARGFHVVKVLQRKDARVKPLSEVRKHVEAAYRGQKQQEMLAKLLKEAREQLKVQMFPEAMPAGVPP